MKLIVRKKDFKLMRKADNLKWQQWYRTGNYQMAQYTPYKRLTKQIFKCDVLYIGNHLQKNRFGSEPIPEDIKVIKYRLPRKEKIRLRKLFNFGFDIRYVYEQRKQEALRLYNRV